MSTDLNERVIELCIKGTPAQRYHICKDHFAYFCMYYFSHFFSYPSAPFHFNFFSDCEKLANLELNEAAWVAFAESAKTSIAKMFVTWCICYQKRRSINVVSYSRENSERFLLDISTWLRTNKKLVGDYGRLYRKYQKKKTVGDPEDDEDKVKRMSTFMTENKIKVEAFSTQESPRGRVQDTVRPDLWIIDDVENNKTKGSYPVTQKIKNNLDEIKRGMAPNASVLYLCNYITEEGVVAYIMERVRDNPKGMVRNIPVIKDDKPTWPGKYVMTNEDAVKVNADITDPLKMKISLEEKRRSLTDRVFQPEMMNNPSAGDDKVFDRTLVEDLIARGRPPLRVIAGLKIWADFNPSHRYVIAADTAKGIGKDSNASAIIDLTTIPNRIVATYKNNLMAPDVFAYELKRQAGIYGNPLIGPEINNTGYATVSVLKRIYPTASIYVPVQDEKVKEKLADEFGYDTNAATKPKMVYEFKTALEDGLLVCYDKDLLEEAKYYNQRDLSIFRLQEGMTRHFDLLTAAMIAWAIRNSAKPASLKKGYKQGDHVPSSEFGG